jgi:23S rRNA-intervening sequence protein
MATFKRFEDIRAWQKARLVTRKIYEIRAQGRFSKDYGLRNQSQRASVSIMANIAEGFGRHSDKEFANFLSMAPCLGLGGPVASICRPRSVIHFHQSVRRIVWLARRDRTHDACSC